MLVRPPTLLVTDSPADNPVALIDLKPWHCRWPCSGEGHNTIYCGGKREKGRPYCSRHSAIAFKPKEAPRKDWVQFGTKATVCSAIGIDLIGK